MRGGIDRISLLPDCLAHNILSLLRTKESVRTSVLSKRWLNVWKSVPRLDLDYSDFNQRETFEAFVNSVFQHKLFPNVEQLDEFYLFWVHDCSEECYETVKTWISNVVRLKPRVVSIEISGLGLDRVDFFFSCLFTCKTLESLFLWPQFDFDVVRFNPGTVNLPFLKCLHVGSILLEDEFVQKLMQGCPVLEKIVFDSCLLSFTQRISSNSLKKLVILSPEFYGDARLKISIPSLVYLECEAILGSASFENLELLEHANVTLAGVRNDYNGLEDLEEVKLLRSLSKAKTIQLKTCSLRKHQ